LVGWLVDRCVTVSQKKVGHFYFCDNFGKGDFSTATAMISLRRVLTSCAKDEFSQYS